MSPFGLTILLLIIAFHSTAFIAGYFLTGMVFHKTPDVKALQRTLSYETGSSFALSVHKSVGIYETNKFFTFAGMQSSLLALALANRFFQDPLVGVPPAISVSQCLGLKTNFFLFTNSLLAKMTWNSSTVWRDHYFKFPFCFVPSNMHTFCLSPC